MPSRSVAPVLAGALLLACAEPSSPGRLDAAHDFWTSSSGSATRRLAVMTQNLYVGTDVDAIIRALASPDPSDDLPTLLAGVETVERTDFPTRARAIADEIARDRPHVVGLQEVSVIDVDLRPLGLPVALQVDFLPALLAELARHGLDYQVAVQGKNFEVAPLPFVQLTDYDAILVDASRAVVSAASAHVFSNNVGVVAPGVNLTRGWVTVDVVVEGVTYAVASTHLESGNLPGLDQLRAAQAAELVASLSTAHPAILMGDLNDQAGSPMYQVISDAGFVDSWAELRPGAAGLSCCQASDLSNQVPAFNQRLDYVWARGLASPKAGLEGTIDLVGEVPADQVPGPAYQIWPSDHAGLLADLLFPAGLGN